jgi:hypothetical protein
LMIRARVFSLPFLLATGNNLFRLGIQLYDFFVNKPIDDISIMFCLITLGKIKCQFFSSVCQGESGMVWLFPLGSFQRNARRKA